MATSGERFQTLTISALINSPNIGVEIMVLSCSSAKQQPKRLLARKVKGRRKKVVQQQTWQWLVAHLWRSSSGGPRFQESLQCFCIFYFAHSFCLRVSEQLLTDVQNATRRPRGRVLSQGPAPRRRPPARPCRADVIAWAKTRRISARQDDDPLPEGWERVPSTQYPDKPLGISVFL